MTLHIKLDISSERALEAFYASAYTMLEIQLPMSKSSPPGLKEIYAQLQQVLRDAIFAVMPPDRAAARLDRIHKEVEQLNTLFKNIEELSDSPMKPFPEA